MFEMLKANNIFVKSNFFFVNYFIVQLFNQKINLLNLIIVEKKLKIIFRLLFSIKLQLLKIYLKFIN